jgi:hypothetical protein
MRWNRISDERGDPILLPQDRLVRRCGVREGDRGRKGLGERSCGMGFRRG